MKAYPLAEYGQLAAGVREVLISSEEIDARVAELGRAISADYAGRTPLLAGVLKGVFIFMADLLRAITIPVEVDFIDIASYTPEARDRGFVQFVKDLDINAAGRHLIFVEDVVDTGLTLNYLLRNMRARNPASLEVCALFDKRTRRIADVPIRYVGFALADEFVVGYGLDFHQRYRNLPFLAKLRPEQYRPDPSAESA